MSDNVKTALSLNAIESHKKKSWIRILVTKKMKLLLPCAMTNIKQNVFKSILNFSGGLTSRQTNKNNLLS